MNNYDIEPEIHFKKLKDFIGYHDKINTNIEIISEYESPDKLINFKKVTNDLSIYENSECDENIFFISNDIYEDKDILTVEGTIGYFGDPLKIKLIHVFEENKIYVLNIYRLLYSEIDYKLFNNRYNITNGLILDNIKQEDNTQKIIYNKTKGFELLKMNENSIPYYRFPRSKDGISIPRAIYNIFKIFESEIKPEIIIPTELYICNRL